MSNTSPYAVSSVDTALRLALILQAEGPLRSSELAERLGIARSTAHRLLSMLVNRGFAEQRDDKRYDAGPALQPVAVPSSRAARLRAAAAPRLQTLRDQTGETVNLEVLSGTQVKYLVTIESPQSLKVGNRDGWISPAWGVSGGRALLAQFPNEQVRDLLLGDGLEEDQLPQILRGLALIRKRGFALNDQTFEAGVTAIAKPLHDEDGMAIAAVAVAMPSARFSRERLPELITQITRAVEDIEQVLARSEG